MGKNLEIMERFYAFAATSYQSGSASLPAEAQALLHPEMEFHEPESLPYGGVFKGPEGFLEMYAKTVETWELDQMVPGEYVEGDDVIVALNWLKGRGRSSGQPIDMPLVAVWRFEDGLIKHVRVFAYDTHQMLSILGHE